MFRKSKGFTLVEPGITLTSIGFGMGNYNDVLMEKLANLRESYWAKDGSLHAFSKTQIVVHSTIRKENSCDW